MAKSELKVGAEIEFITPGEQEKQLQRFFKLFEDLMRGQEGETISRSSGSFLTDASGGTSSLAQGGHSVYRVPVGYDAYLTRLSVDFEGSNASSPTTCDLRIVADQNTPAGLRSLADQVPNVFNNSKSHAPLFRGGQEIVVCLTGGPATTAIYCTAQVILTPRKHIAADILDTES